MVVLFVFFGLFFSQVMEELHDIVWFPMAPVLIVLTTIIGYFWKNLSWVGECSRYIVDIDPHLIMTIFLVPIVFESALMADGFVMKKNWAPI